MKISPERSRENEENSKGMGRKREKKIQKVVRKKGNNKNWTDSTL